MTVRATQDVPPSTATADVRAISVTQASFDGTALTVAASAGAPAAYPLRVEAGGVVGELPSPAPVSFPLAAPPASITVSSGAVRTSAPVVVTGGMAATTTAHVAATALTAPRGIATVIDGRGSTNATTFRTVIKSGPQGAVLVDDTTSTPRIVLPTWAAPTDVLPRVAPAATPTVVTFTASDGGASSSIDVTVTPAGDTVAVTTARSVAGELRVDGTSTIPGATPPPDAPTQVVVYARTSPVSDPTGTEPGWVKIGSAAVDPAGAFSVRPSPAPDVAYVQYLMQTSRGTLLTALAGSRSPTGPVAPDLARATASRGAGWTRRGRIGHRRALSPSSPPVLGALAPPPLGCGNRQVKATVNASIGIRAQGWAAHREHRSTT